jgi:Protein of unknown function (DUF3611)
MQIDRESSPHLNFEQVVTILRIAGWVSFVMQISLAAVASVLLLLAIAGRSLNRSIALPAGVPISGVGTQTTTPGLGVGIFWAVCGVLVLLFGSYLAFRMVRFAKRLGNPNRAIRPQRTKVMQVLKLSVITGLVGILLMILGTGATIGVLLAKSISLPQGVALYDPSRSIRSLDVFVAAANTTGITAHFIGVVAALSVFNWLHRPSDQV